jgi:uncharacterized protein YdeI (YjbR/CyaY-like superfamily)
MPASPTRAERHPRERWSAGLTATAAGGSRECDGSLHPHMGIDAPLPTARRRGGTRLPRTHQARVRPGGTPDIDEIRRKARFFRDRAELRSWFGRHHATETELWIAYYKQGVDARAVTYTEAVEEALCFGWIDGQVRSLGERAYANRYTPRKPGSRWSRVNVRKAKELLEGGRMDPAGAAAFSAGGTSRPARYRYERSPREFSPELQQRFRSHRKGWTFFAQQPMGYRRTAVRWVMGARRPATRLQRLEVLMAASNRAERIDWIHPGRRRSAPG